MTGAANENIIQFKMKLILTSLQGSIAFRERETDIEIIFFFVYSFFFFKKKSYNFMKKSNFNVVCVRVLVLDTRAPSQITVQRSSAQHKPSDNNAVFDCKVLHAFYPVPYY